MWNVDFQSVFPAVTIQDLNKLERAYLQALQFTVTLKASVYALLFIYLSSLSFMPFRRYAKYYFELRALSGISEESFPMKPLDKDGATKLELVYPLAPSSFLAK